MTPFVADLTKNISVRVGPSRLLNSIIRFWASGPLVLVLWLGKGLIGTLAASIGSRMVRTRFVGIERSRIVRRGEGTADNWLREKKAGLVAVDKSSEVGNGTRRSSLNSNHKRIVLRTQTLKDIHLEILVRDRFANEGKLVDHRPEFLDVLEAGRSILGGGLKLPPKL